MPATGQRVKVTGYDPGDLKYGAIDGQEGVITLALDPALVPGDAFEVELDNFPGDPWVFYADELAVI